MSPGFGATTWAAPSRSIWLAVRGSSATGACRNRIYEKRGFRRIAPFGEHVNDATSLGYELQVERQRRAMEV